MLLPRARPVVSVVRDLETILTPLDEKGRGLHSVEGTVHRMATALNI